VDLATVGPLRLEVVSVEPAQAGQVSVLVEVTAERGGPGNTPGLSTINGWPVRYAAWSHMRASIQRSSYGDHCKCRVSLIKLLPEYTLWTD